MAPGSELRFIISTMENWSSGPLQDIVEGSGSSSSGEEADAEFDVQRSFADPDASLGVSTKRMTLTLAKSKSLSESAKGGKLQTTANTIVTYLQAVNKISNPRGRRRRASSQAQRRGVSGRVRRSASVERPSLNIARSPVKRLQADYSVGKVIGAGGLCFVNLATHHLTGEQVALKIVRINEAAALGSAGHEMVSNIIREQVVLEMMHHPNIVALYETFSTPEIMYISMEYAQGGELLDYIQAQGHLEEQECCAMVSQIAGAVLHIHNRGYIHRDIKPENILLDKARNVKLVDFGLADKLPSDGKRLQGLERGCTPAYTAPEVIVDDPDVPLGTAIDVWGMGVVLYVMLTGQLPFGTTLWVSGAVADRRPSGTVADRQAAARIERAHDRNGMALHGLFQDIVKGDYITPSFVSRDAYAVLEDMLCTNPHNRVTCLRMLSYQWFKRHREQQDSTSSKPSSPRTSFCVGRRTQFAPMRRTSESRVDVDASLLEEMTTMGFNPDIVAANIIAGRSNHVTTTYKLLQAKHSRMGIQSPTSSKRRLAPATAAPERVYEARMAKVKASSCAAKIEEITQQIQLLPPNEHNQHGDCYVEMAVMLRKDHELRLALEKFDEALHCYHKESPVDLGRVGKCLGSRAIILVQQDRVAEALTMMKEALEAKLVAFGPDSPSVANTLNNIANLLDDTGDFAGAIGRYQEALRIFTINDAKDGIGDAYYNMARCEQSRGSTKDAVNYFRQAVKWYASCHGKDHDETICAQNDLEKAEAQLRALESISALESIRDSESALSSFDSDARARPPREEERAAHSGAAPANSTTTDAQPPSTITDLHRIMRGAVHKASYSRGGARRKASTSQGRKASTSQGTDSPGGVAAVTRATLRPRLRRSMSQLPVEPFRSLRLKASSPSLRQLPVVAGADTDVAERAREDDIIGDRIDVNLSRMSHVRRKRKSGLEEMLHTGEAVDFRQTAKSVKEHSWRTSTLHVRSASSVTRRLST